MNADKIQIEKKYDYDEIFDRAFPKGYKFDFTESKTDESFVPEVEKVCGGVVAGIDMAKVAENSVENFGAKGDGVTDDTAAIFEAYEKSNGKIYFPSGKYLMNKTLEICDDTVIYGENAEMIIEDDISCITGENKKNIYIKGIYINKKWTDNSVKYGIYLSECKNIVIDGCEISGFGARAGISLRYHCEWFSITNNYCHDFAASKIGPLEDGKEQDTFGIEVRWGGNNGIIMDNVIDNLTTLEPNLSARRVQADGIYLGAGSYNILVESNYITRVGEGIDLGKNHNVIMRNNTLISISLWGIKIGQGSYDCLAEDNYIEDSGFAALHAYANIGTNGLQTRTIFRRNVVVDCNRSQHFPNQYEEHKSGVFFSANDDEVNGSVAGCQGNTVEYNVIIQPKENKNIRFGMCEAMTSRKNCFRYNYIEGVEEQNIHNESEWIAY